jgi:replicative DNA helicase
MDELSLQSLSGVLEQADGRLRAGSHAAGRVWPTGFETLDTHLGGGFRRGELILLGGPPGLGTTTWVLQTARNVARDGRSAVVFSFEHDPQSLLMRLVALEAGEVADLEAPDLGRIRRSFEAADGRRGTLAERLADTTGGREALENVAKYAERLVLHRSTGTSTTLEVIAEGIDEVRRDTGQLPLVVIDYLQKVKVPGGSYEEEERVGHVVESLKDLALDLDIPVLAVVAADKAGLASGKRMRVTNLRGSSALAYEADTVLLLNNKYDVVARQHLVYDLGNAERFRQWAVLSIEKNRNGLAGVDMEFRKRFAQSRFEPEGRLVTEQLVDERVFVE